MEQLQNPKDTGMSDCGCKLSEPCFGKAGCKFERQNLESDCPSAASCSKAGDLAREILPEVTAIMQELFNLYDDHESTLPQRINSIRQRLIVEDVKSR